MKELYEKKVIRMMTRKGVQKVQNSEERSSVFYALLKDQVFSMNNWTF